MKNSNLKKFLSAAAVLAFSATAALAAIPFAACSENGGGSSQGENNDKLISVDKNHSADIISTAQGDIRTQSSGRVYYVAPDGSIANDGLSWDSPYSIVEILKGGDITLQPGDTVYVKPGTYTIVNMVTAPADISGAYNKYIRIVNAALEKDRSGYTGSETLATLDFSGQNFGSAERGVQLYGNYFYWYGIDVCGAGDNGLYIGGSYNTVEYCEFYNNRDTGLQLGRAESSLNSIDQWPSYNLIKNCTSHNNYDNETYGENADGFAAKLTVGYGNVFDGCIAYRNSDDGWDLYAKTDSGNIGCVIIYNCVAFENGYLEYTQADNNARFPKFNTDYTEIFNEGDDVRYFRTRDGDGNGFKLGGSVMEGDVEMYNCLSFNNRMHGVTDNSNPGYLKVEGVTSYDNSAAVDDNPDSPTFGQIIKKENVGGTHGNIDVSRQTYSYNSVINTLSVSGGIAVSLDSDAYRGSVTDSILCLGYNALKSNRIQGSIDADTKNPGGLTNTDQITIPAAADIFKTLPVVQGTEGYEFNLSGLYDLYETGVNGALKAKRVHKTYRNADGSINMKNILAKKDGIDGSLISGKNIGSTLNLNGWGEYKHFFANDYTDENAAGEDEAKLARALETLTINCDANAVYQDFEVPVKLNGCTIEWSTENEELVTIGTDIEESISTSKYIYMHVYRPSENDATVKITATVTCGSAVGNKDFNLTIKSGIPSIGEIAVLTQNGDIIKEGGSYVVDQFNVFREPTVLVENGLDYHGKYLKPSQFTCETTYLYAKDKGSAFIEIKGFTPSNAGVYQITKTVRLTSDPSQSASMNYTVYVSSLGSQIDFMNESNAIVVNRDGYMISGELSNATGRIYAVSSTEDLEITKDNIKTVKGVESYEFRGDKINYQFSNKNGEAYNVYYALTNLNGEVTTEIYKASVGVVDISTPAEFKKIANGEKIGEEAPATTIYKLSGDIDFSGIAWERKASEKPSAFTGLLNGAGYTVKNVSVTGDNQVAGLGLFYKVEGGTIENIKFDNISIVGGKQQCGIIGTSCGGYYHNIAITNIKVDGATRSGALIGHVFEYSLPTYISQVSVVNDNNDDYFISANTGHRAGGIVGFIQTTSSPVDDVRVYITDCYVIAKISGAQQVGGIVGGFDNAKPTIDYYLEIDRCYFGGVALTTYTTPRVGGIIGYQSGNIGYFTIKHCLSVGTLINQGFVIGASLKTASLIVGGFSSAAINVVESCVASMEEYNTDYNVEVFTDRNLQRNVSRLKVLLDIKDDNQVWSFVSAEDPENPTYLKAPYLKLNFIN